MINPDFPFGELDPDLKGYFRTVEDQIKDWEGSSSVGEEREGECGFVDQWIIRGGLPVKCGFALGAR
jgi:hypothetical protein